MGPCPQTAANGGSNCRKFTKTLKKNIQRVVGSCIFMLSNFCFVLVALQATATPPSFGASGAKWFEWKYRATLRPKIPSSHVQNH